MSDPLNMSLDDIIKQKKTKKAQVVRAKGRNRVERGKKTKVGASPKGLAGRNFKGKLTYSPQKKNGFISARRGRGGGRYFNSPTRKVDHNWDQGAGNNLRRKRNRVPRFNATMPVEGYQYWRGVLNPAVIRRAKARAMANINLTRRPASFGSFYRRGNRTLAQKSVNRARQMLIRRRILENKRNRGNFSPTGRILVGEYGLMTTQRQNVKERQNMMQRKIQRARQVREQRQIQNTPTESIVFSRSRRGRGGGRGRMQQGQVRNNMTRMWPSPITYDEVHSSTPSPRYRFGKEDDWIPPLMTVRNQELTITTPKRSGSGLDPNIQRKIKYIQQQGRKNRGNEARQGQIPSNRYLDEDEDTSSFQPTIITSRMSLSERFKSFMGS